MFFVPMGEMRGLKLLYLQNSSGPAWLVYADKISIPRVTVRSPFQNVPSCAPADASEFLTPVTNAILLKRSLFNM